MRNILISIFSLLAFIPSVHAENTWDCSKILLKKFHFGKDCMTNGIESANDPRDKEIKVNKGCFIVVSVAGKEKTLNFMTPSPYWSDNINFSRPCEGTKGISNGDLTDKCYINLIHGTDDIGKKVRCECSKLGCGQHLVRLKDIKENDIQEKIRVAMKSLSPKCDDLAFGGFFPDHKRGATRIYMSSLKCPLAGTDHECPRDSRLSEFSYHGSTIAVCVPSEGDTETQKPASEAQ
ncbi:MAG: hypothetical protein ACXVB1_04770 [Pseudobdellovibrionaceae bacterium]